MSTPKRGMVAGQPITTGAPSQEYDEGFERTFGERKPTRGRFVYTSGGRPLPEPVQVGEDFQNTRGLQAPFTDGYMDGIAATDGTDIGSRKKRREWMKANNLADADDFKGTWEKAAKERAAYYQGTHDTKEIRETVGRAMYEARKKGRR